MKKRLLIQENEQDLVEILCIALEMENYETLSVLGYDFDFSALIRLWGPHLVMLDYRLDGKNCLRLAKEIRSDFPMLPMIAMSCSVTIAESYSDYGFNGFLPKPFQLDGLYTLLKSLIA